nr:bicaudal d protein [Hymenolepis microstoma]
MLVRMDSQVDFLQHASASSDSFGESDVTTVVFEDNLRLRHENQRLLEQFRQQIHEIQHEKETVRLRLIAVESDYDTQLKELQIEIMNLREEVQQQKRRCMRANLECEETVQSLTEKNAALKEELLGAHRIAAESTAHVKEMQQHLQSARVLIQSHVQHIETLRAEIDQLKEDKLTLEQKLQAITEERDSLLTALSDTQQVNALLQQENANQQLLISHQENELEQLQKATALLKNHLQTLNSAASPARNEGTSKDSGKPGGQYSDPHQSLMGELSGLNQDSEEDQWWHKHIQLDPSMTEFYEDDGIEIGDVSLHAALTTSGGLIGNKETGNTLKIDVDLNDLDPVCYSEGEFIESFRTEVAEIYQQLRQMCLDVSAQSVNSNLSGPGDSTPDQLARIEWDFRLASLRNVLTDLRGLLQDLVAIPSKAS